MLVGSHRYWRQIDAEGEKTRCTSPGVKMVASGEGEMNGKRVQEFESEFAEVGEVKRKQY